MPEFQCELCRVHVNSQDQLNIHTNGQKHQKKLKMKLTVTPVAALAESAKVVDSSSKLYGTFVAASSDATSPTEGASTSTSHQTPDSTTNQKTDAKQPANQKPTYLYKLQPGQWPSNPMTDFEFQPQIPGMSDPVRKAVLGNAMGQLPLKRKAYGGRCQYCNVDYTSESHEYQHLAGNKHAKKKKLADATSSFHDSLTVPEGFSGFTCQYCNVMLNTMDQYETHRKGGKHKKNLELLKKMGKATEESKGVVMAIVPKSK